MYLEHFKLTKLPFSVTPSTDFYCNIPAHQKTYDALMLAIQHDGRLIKVIGDNGSGKTMLCNLLLNTLSDEFITIYISKEHHEKSTLYTLIAEEFCLNNPTDEHIANTISSHLLTLHQAGKQTVLIIDDADSLSDDSFLAIHTLLHLEADGEKLLKIILLGDSTLNKKLNSPALHELKSNINCSYHLPSLNKQEMNNYLTHRLEKAGDAQGMLFSNSAKKKLFRASKGLPLLLNILSHKALLISFSRGRAHVDIQSMKRAIADTNRTPSAQQPISSGTILLVCTTIICVTLIFVVYRNAGII